MKKGKFYFSSDISELIAKDESAPSELKEGEVYKVKIPIFREGKFKHPWYGDLDFTLDYLNELKRNHQMSVFPQRVSFDVNHNPGNGAIAWLEEDSALSVEQVSFNTPTGSRTKWVLFAEAELNPRGYKLVKNKEYRYFSSEIHPNFTTGEVEKVNTGKGEVEAVVEYGAVLVGGGLTNRPFIPHLGEIGLSSPDGEINEAEFSDKVSQFSCVASDDIKFGLMFAAPSEERVSEEVILPVSEPPQLEEVSDLDDRHQFNRPEKVKFEDIVSQDAGNTTEANIPPVQETFTDLNEGESKMKFSQVLTQLQAVEGAKGQVEYLKSIRQQFSGDELVTIDAILKSKEEAVIALSERDDAVQRKVAADTQAEADRARAIALSNDLVEAREGSWRNKVKAYCAELRQEGQHESVVKTVETMLNGMKKDTRDLKFSVVTGDATKDFDVIGFLSEIFSSMPESAKLSTAELTSANEQNEVEVVPVPVQLSTPAPAATPVAPAAPSNEDPKAARIAKFSARYGYEPTEDLYDAIDENGMIDLDLV